MLREILKLMTQNNMGNRPANMTLCKFFIFLAVFNFLASTAAAVFNQIHIRFPFGMRNNGGYSYSALQCKYHAQSTYHIITPAGLCCSISQSPLWSMEGTIMHNTSSPNARYPI